MTQSAEALIRMSLALYFFLTTTLIAPQPLFAQTVTKEQVYGLIKQCEDTYNQYDFRGALPLCLNAVSAAEKLENLKYLSTAYTDLGLAYYDLGNYQKAIEFHIKALQVVMQSGNTLGEGQVYGNLGIVYHALGNYQKAIEFDNKALQIAMQSGNRLEEGQMYGNLGIAYYALGNYQKAIEFLNKRLKIALELGDRIGEGKAYGNLGFAYDSLGEYQKAIEFLNKSLKIDRELGDKLGEGQVYGNLGITYKHLGDYEKAIEFHTKALQIDIQIGSKSSEGQDYGNLGNTYYALGDYQKAIEFQQKSLKIALEIGDKSGESNAYGNLGNNYYALGDYQKAIESQNKRLKIVLEIGDTRGEGQVYGNLGGAYYALGDYQKSIEYQNKFLKIVLEHREKLGEAQAYGSLGNAYFSVGDYEKAIEFHTKALQIDIQIGSKSSEGRDYGNLGNTYYTLGDYQKAIEFQQKSLKIALEIGDKSGESKAYGNLGNIYEKLQRYDEALLLHQQAITLISALGTIQDLYYPQWAIARILLAQGKQDLAILFYKQAINTIQFTKERIKELDPALKKSFGASKSSVYRDLADLLLKQGRVFEAQKVLDLLKEQETIEYLRSETKRSGGATKLNEDEQKVWQKYQEQVLGKELALYQQRDTIRAQIKLIPLSERVQSLVFQRLQAELAAIEEKFNLQVQGFEIFLKQAAASFKPLDATRTVESLQDDANKYYRLLSKGRAALISPLVLPNRLELILALPKPNTKPIQRTVKVTKKELDTVILHLRQNLDRPGGDTLADLQQLYKWLVMPFESELTSLKEEKLIDTLVFAPDDNLRLIPMATLHDGKQYLIEKMPIGTVDRLSTLDTSTSGTSQLLAMGLSKSQEDFSALPAVVEEITNISKIYPGPVLLDEKFTAFNLQESLDTASKEPQSLILHMATHASFGSSEKDTFILLFKGRINLNTLKSLDLRNISLFTLSACETAANDGRSGKGLAVVAEASGALSVMGSLWSVNDASTSLLMQQFYTNLKSGMGKALALQQAQLALIRGLSKTNSPTENRGGIVPQSNGKAPATTTTFSDPFYWAPFILIGEWR